MCAELRHSVSTFIGHRATTLPTQRLSLILWPPRFFFGADSMIITRRLIPLIQSNSLSNLWHAWKDFLGSRHSLLSQFSFISLPDQISILWRSYVYSIYTYLTAYRLYMKYRCYQITLQWNIFTQIGAVRSVNWIFIIEVSAWRWTGEYVTLDRTFCNILSNRKQ